MDQSEDFSLPHRVRDLIARQPAGRSMLGQFYSDEEVHEVDCRRIWRTGWIFAGHSCEISKPGDYVTFEIDGDSIILIRDENGAAQALYNVCRHRGSLICDHSEGHVKKLVCPYHRWAYGLDGRLL